MESLIKKQQQSWSKRQAAASIMPTFFSVKPHEPFQAKEVKISQNLFSNNLFKQPSSAKRIPGINLDASDSFGSDHDFNKELVDIIEKSSTTQT